MYLVIFEKQLWQFHLLFRYGHNPSSVPFMPRKFLSVSPMSNVLALRCGSEKIIIIGRRVTNTYNYHYKNFSNKTKCYLPRLDFL